MGFDKNTVIGIALIMLIFFGFEIYNVKQQAEYQKQMLLNIQLVIQQLQLKHPI